MSELVCSKGQHLRQGCNASIKLRVSNGMASQLITSIHCTTINMNSFIAVFFLAAVAMASAGHVGLGWAGHGGWGGHGGWNPAAHIASGSVAVGPNGATIAGPAGTFKYF